ncbi:hypothetical protein WMY93_021218 [Mugilogobius chulae]|uniref:Uncharacterized protein n=1 Tax=Mugilogobius chulae TaxID=88201 RepID=A0AAW0NMA4_9GOBI
MTLGFQRICMSGHDTEKLDSEDRQLKNRSGGKPIVFPKPLSSEACLQIFLIVLAFLIPAVEFGLITFEEGMRSEQQQGGTSLRQHRLNMKDIKLYAILR